MGFDRLDALRDGIERRQIGLYLVAAALALALAAFAPALAPPESWINPALALMLFATFLQTPWRDLARAMMRPRFMAALLIANFLLVPVLALALIGLAPAEPLWRMAVLIVLLAPCVDYVVTFAGIGGADARPLLAATPVLLIAQILLLPVYLPLYLGGEAMALIAPGPFLHAFVWLIAVPLALAAVAQEAGARLPAVGRGLTVLGLLPAPATALVLFIVIAAVTPMIGAAAGPALMVAPLYLAFAAIAPLLGWGAARLARLPAPEGRAVAFSAGTRNALVVLPLVMALPGAMPVLPALVVTQTLVELMASLAYMRLIPRLGANQRGTPAA